MAALAQKSAKQKVTKNSANSGKEVSLVASFKRLTIRDDDIEAAVPLLAKESPMKFMAEEHIMVRAEASIGSVRTGQVLRKGDTFVAEEIVTLDEGHHVQWDHVPVDEPCFLSLGGDAGGWIYSQNPVTEASLITQVAHDDDQESVLTRVQHTMRKVLMSRAYDYFINSVVIANSVVVGLDIDHREMLSTRTWDLINLFFAAVYVTEVVVKLSVLGVRPYFESNWNRGDFAITLATLIADMGPMLRTLVPAFQKVPRTEIVGAVAPILRLFRLVRLGKIFPDFRSLVSSFVLSIEGLFWAIILMLLWFFISACITTVFLGQMPGDPSIPEFAHIRHMFSTIPMSMFSLFEVMTLVAFQECVRPLLGKRPGMVMFFCVFIFTSFFVLLNLITGVVTDRMLMSKASDQRMAEALETDKREMILHDLKLLLKRRSEVLQSPSPSPMAPEAKPPIRPRMSRQEAGIASCAQEASATTRQGDEEASEVSSFDILALTDPGKEKSSNDEQTHESQLDVDIRGKVVKLDAVKQWVEDPDVKGRLQLVRIDPTLVLAACAVLSKDDRGCVGIDKLLRILRNCSDQISNVDFVKSQANLAWRCEQRTDRLLELLTRVKK